MKKYHLFCTLIVVLFGSLCVKACDEASASINSIVDNANGTYDVTYDVCVEFYGLEGNPSSWSFNYNNPNTIVVANFSPATILSLDGDVFTGTLRDGNCDAEEDDVYGACDGVNNVLQYYYPGFIPTNAGADMLCFSVTMTIQGYPTSVDVVTNGGETTYPTCTKTIVFPTLPLCNISAVTTSSQGTCDPSTGTFSQQLVVSYTDPPTTGTLDVNGQSFAISTSPQTINLVGLAANNTAVDVTASFSDEVSCTITEVGLFTAPCLANCAGAPMFGSN